MISIQARFFLSSRFPQSAVISHTAVYSKYVRLPPESRIIRQPCLPVDDVPKLQEGSSLAKRDETRDRKHAGAGERKCVHQTKRPDELTIADYSVHGSVFVTFF